MDEVGKVKIGSKIGLLEFRGRKQKLTWWKEGGKQEVGSTEISGKGGLCGPGKRGLGRIEGLAGAS